MKYVIYGGNGFVGSHLVENLHSKDQEIVVCDINPDIDKKINGKCKYIIADIRDIDSLKSIPIEQDDVVINLAANQYHQRVPKDAYHYFFDTNTLGTKNILDDMISKSAHNFLSLQPIWFTAVPRKFQSKQLTLWIPSGIMA